MSDPNLLHLGLFMATGLGFLAKIVKSSTKNNNMLDNEINKFINENKKFGIEIKIDNELINITYKGIFICRVNTNDYNS